ncbi:MAG TPA: hypothetical protein VIL46_07065 [Gemmataceae bacterium]
MCPPVRSPRRPYARAGAVGLLCGSCFCLALLWGGMYPPVAVLFSLPLTVSTAWTYYLSWLYRTSQTAESAAGFRPCACARGAPRPFSFDEFGERPVGPSVPHGPPGGRRFEWDGPS